MRTGISAARWMAAMVMAVTLTACGGQADDEAAEAGRDATNAAGRAADSVGDAVANGGRAADAAVETLDVKTALITDDRVDAGDINVDSNHETKTVTLKGTVPTTAQRAAAEEIAKAQAVGYRVVNELTVKR